MATASAFVRMGAETLEKVTQGGLSKGDALGVARVAGIMAAKKTSDLIPLCHPLSLTDIEVAMQVGTAGITVTSTVKTLDRTGVEMEAMVAASIAALTLYDMCKAVDKAITIEEVALISKSGGKSGDYARS